jgi:HEAT repeat protein
MASAEPSQERVRQLIKLLINETQEIQNQAQDELKMLGADSVPQLLSALGDPDSWYEAAEVLANIEEALPELINCLRIDRIANAASHALTRSGTKATRYLVKALGDESADVRSWAALILGLTKDRRAVDALEASINDKEEDVQRNVILALEEIGDSKALSVLRAALLANTNPEVSIILGETLDRIEKRSRLRNK